MEDGGVVVPVIDLKEFPNEYENMVQACKEWGTFRIVNHGIPLTLLCEMKQVVRCLLDLPEEIKQKNRYGTGGSGYMAPNTSTPLYEGLVLYGFGSPLTGQEFCNQLGASSLHRETIMSYSAALHHLLMDLWRKLAKGMGVEAGPMEGWKCQLRVNKYNFSQQTLGSLGVPVHTDSGFLTILQEDDSVGGLEIMPRSSASSSFLPVHPVPGTLLVNLGDMATAWSNGILHNVKHRVQCKEASIRVSIAMLLVGPKEAVESPPQFVDDSHPRIYRPFSYEDCRNLRLSTGYHAGEVLELFRLTADPQTI